MSTFKLIFYVLTFKDLENARFLSLLRSKKHQLSTNYGDNLGDKYTNEVHLKVANT